MSEPFLAEIKIVAFDFAPRGFSFCDGQLLPINQNQSLFSLLGTSYGGNGRTDFALPDLRGRVPQHPDNTGNPGGNGGSEDNVLAANNLPAHRHAVKASTATANAATPAGNLLAPTSGGRRSVVPYGSASNLVPMAGTESTGSSAPVNNMQPYLALRFCIAMRGIFPSRN